MNPAENHQLYNQAFLHIFTDLFQRAARFTRFADEFAAGPVSHPFRDIVEFGLDFLIGDLERLVAVIRDQELPVDQVVDRLAPDLPDRFVKPVA